MGVAPGSPRMGSNRSKFHDRQPPSVGEAGPCAANRAGTGPPGRRPTRIGSQRAVMGDLASGRAGRWETVAGMELFYPDNRRLTASYPRLTDNGGPTDQLHTRSKAPGPTQRPPRSIAPDPRPGHLAPTPLHARARARKYRAGRTPGFTVLPCPYPVLHTVLRLPRSIALCPPIIARASPRGPPRAIARTGLCRRPLPPRGRRQRASHTGGPPEVLGVV
jgi:hypothetical protein